MRMITLVENTCGNTNCIAEHGLCIYIETEKHKLLLDSGQTDALIKNAAALGIDLGETDTVILSHGHYDHSGGILPFSQINKKARIIMQRTAAGEHYNGDRYIGIDKAVLALPNTELIDGDIRLDDELFLFSGIKGRKCFPTGNKTLFRIDDGIKHPDDFVHEQCLVITQNGMNILLSGCAHNGVLNILDRYREIFDSDPDIFISGFHMMKKDAEHTEEEKEVIRMTARELAKTNIQFFSGHCTGEPAFDMMKEILKEQITAIHSGETIILKQRI